MEVWERAIPLKSLPALLDLPAEAPESPPMVSPSNSPVLLVDDDRNLLDSLSRRYRKLYELHTAEGGHEALQKIEGGASFAVVISDYQMPGMDGIAFLRRVREVAPEAVRIMLTGNADLGSAIEAVNQGHVFRFLTKPCGEEAFQAAVDAGLEMFRLRCAERELLQQTLRGSIEVLVDVLSLANPSAFGRAQRLQHYVRHQVRKLGLSSSWKYETAALLSQIGLVALPSDIIDRIAEGQELTPDQERLFDRHPAVTGTLLEKIPRLEDVAAMIVRAGRPRPGDSEEIALGTRILALASRFDELLTMGAAREEALQLLRKEQDKEGLAALHALKDVPLPGQDAERQVVPVSSLRPGMVLDQNLKTATGVMLVTKGQRVTAGMIARLRNYAELGSLDEPVRVLVQPQGGRDAEAA